MSLVVHYWDRFFRRCGDVPDDRDLPFRPRSNMDRSAKSVGHDHGSPHRGADSDVIRPRVSVHEFAPIHRQPARKCIDCECVLVELGAVDEVTCGKRGLSKASQPRMFVRVPLHSPEAT